MFPFPFPFVEFWKHVPPPRVDDGNDDCVPNVKGHSCFLFSALTILFASWLTSRFVPTRNIKLCQGKTTSCPANVSSIYFFPPSLFSPPLLLYLFSFLFSFFLSVFSRSERWPRFSSVRGTAIMQNAKTWKNWTWRAWFRVYVVSLIYYYVCNKEKGGINAFCVIIVKMHGKI